MLKFVNNWKTTLQAAVLAADGTLQVPSGAAALLVGLGAGDTYRLTLAEVNVDGAEVAWEIVTASANAGGLLTVTRGEEGTSARDWPAGTRIAQRLTAGSMPTAGGPPSWGTIGGTLLDQEDLALALAGKVDEEAGKGLSTEDYSTADKAKLAGIAPGATATPPFAPVEPETGAARTADLNDAGCYLRFTNAAASTYTIPPQSSVDWAEDTEIHIRRAAAANLTLTAGAGVTLNAPSGGTLVMTNAMSVTLKRVAENVWDVIGQTVAA